jgi:uroporphyrinogen-III synthase
VRILLTRPEERQETIQRLRDLGHDVAVVPTMCVEALSFPAPTLQDFDWVVVTSARGVAALPKVSKPPRWAAVGPSTAAALRERGIVVDFVPQESTGAALGESLPEIAGKRVLLPRADRAAGDLPALLRQRGAEVTELAVYRTVVGPEASQQPLAAAMSAGVDVVVFASDSAVQGYRGLGGSIKPAAITIGPRTAEAARRAGFADVVVAVTPDTRALIEAVEMIGGRRVH